MQQFPMPGGEGDSSPETELQRSDRSESCNKLDLSPALLRKRPHRQKVHSGNTSPSPHSKNRREEGRSDAFSRLVLTLQLCSAPLLPHGEFTRTTAPNGELEPSRPLSPALPTQRWHEQRLAVLQNIPLSCVRSGVVLPCDQVGSLSVD